MAKRVISAVLVLTFVFLAVGCSAHIHVVGTGEQQGITVEGRQWYILWGLVPLNDVSTNTMAGDATDYTIRTEQSALDIIMNIFTGAITVYSRTVTVTK